MDKRFTKEIQKRWEQNAISSDEVRSEFREHMKKTTLIRVRPLHRSDTDPVVYHHNDPDEHDGFNPVYPGPIRRTSSLPKDGIGDVPSDTSEHRHFMKPVSIHILSLHS